uniref:Uncharacterized protein n=1 Tax=Peronospora matthiolae TaxID=2874970 RepID=A0AAV1UH06_9STRA
MNTLLQQARFFYVDVFLDVTLARNFRELPSAQGQFKMATLYTWREWAFGSAKRKSELFFASNVLNGDTQQEREEALTKCQI